MNSARFEWKVGLFVFLSLVLLGTLLLQFSKGGTLFAPTYSLRLLVSNVGAIKRHAAVLVAGVPVGSVAKADLNPDGRSVSIWVRIYTRYLIQTNATFVIDQAGFLGDQYVSITPNTNPAPFLTPGAVVQCQEPFNLQEAARSAAVLMKQLDHTAQIVDKAVARVDRILLAESNLTNLLTTLSNFGQISERVGTVVDHWDQLIVSNRASIHLSLSNLASFSGQLNEVSREVQQTLSTNRTGITATVQHLQSASGRANEILTGLERGQGLAGSWLKDEELRWHFSMAVSNLTLLSSNLNKFGLFYKPKPVKSRTALPGLYPGKNPFQ